MEQAFYKSRLSQKYGIEVIIPNQEERNVVHDIIYNELCLGKIEVSSRTKYLEIIEKLSSQDCDAVILGCTEIALLVDQQQTPVRLYDTTKIHAERAVALAIMDTNKKM